jgi:signal transduction histidine kinase
MIPRPHTGPYHRVVEILAARRAGLPRSLGARAAALSPRHQELVQDLGLGVALAAVNVFSLLPYRATLHPLWLALVLVAAEAAPLTWRRSHAIAVGLVIAAARIAYDKIGFGFAPFPLGPAIAFYTVIERRCAFWRWSAFAVVAAGITIGQTNPGQNEPYSTIFQIMIFLTAAAAGMLSRAKRASMQAAQSRADRAEAELDRQTARAAGQERARIARELHDVVAHHVSLIAVQAEAAASLLPGRPAEARRSVEIIGDTARQALTELRRLLGVLRGPAEELQTAPSASLDELGEVLDQVRGTGLEVDFEVVGTPSPLAPGVDLTAYRIIQEALTNTIRHAQATQATVTLSYEPGYITVSITDSGRRRDGPPLAQPALLSPPAKLGQPARLTRPGQLTRPASLLGGAGFGLAGIAERVASCGGHLTVGPTPADGFAVTARLPAL